MRFKVTPLKPFGVLVEPIGESFSVSELDVSRLRELFRSSQLVVLRGFRTFDGAQDFSDYCESWGQISVWPFGKVLELVEHENPEDHIFDNNYVPLHWDGMYRREVPEYQIFHCVQAPLAGQGGRTTFSNTILALKQASSESRELWAKASGVYQRKMEFYHSKTVAPIITKHPHKGYSVIRYNEPPSNDGNFLNPPDLQFTGMKKEDVDRFHRTLKDSLYSPDCFYAHEWEQGDVVIADNFSLLHGREAFVSRAPRHLRRVHVLSDPPLDNPHLESYQ